MTSTDRRKLELGSGLFFYCLQQIGLSYVLAFSGPAILVENVTAVSKRYIRNFTHCQILIMISSLSATAKFPVLMYASVHKINDGDALNYVFSVWLVRCPNCVKHIPLANQTKISISVSLALSISSRLRCHSLRQDLVFLPKMVGPESVPGRSPPASTQVHTHRRRRMTLAVGHCSVGNGMGPVHPGVLHPLRYYNR